MMKHEIIDNFLPSETLDNLLHLMLPGKHRVSQPSIGWYFNPNNSSTAKYDWKLYYLTYRVYDRTIIDSNLYSHIISHFQTSLDMKALIRIKCNLYPNTETLQEHGMHIDYKFSHKAAIFYLNTCNGYTKLKDGTKIDSIENRVLIFDGSEPHCSSTCTDQLVRMNINFNYV